jgi:cytochrome c553
VILTLSRLSRLSRSRYYKPAASPLRLQLVCSLAGCLLVVFGSSALAQTPSKSKPQASTTTIAAPKPVVDYAQRYAQVCASCHGVDGKGAANLAPSLAGQHSFYVITQLFLFKNERRNNAVMNALVKEFSNDDLRGFSDLIGKFPALVTPPNADSPDPSRMAQGKELANKHQCMSCHGGQLSGGQQVPRLAGQHEDYLKRVLTEFREGKRLGYTNAMNEALVGLKQDELDILAYFIARYPSAP